MWRRKIGKSACRFFDIVVEILLCAVLLSVRFVLWFFRHNQIYIDSVEKKIVAIANKNIERIKSCAHTSRITAATTTKKYNQYLVRSYICTTLNTIDLRPCECAMEKINLSLVLNLVVKYRVLPISFNKSTHNFVVFFFVFCSHSLISFLLFWKSSLVK